MNASRMVEVASDVRREIRSIAVATGSDELCQCRKLVEVTLPQEGQAA